MNPARDVTEFPDGDAAWERLLAAEYFSGMYI